ncbi:hypothetical protein BCR42DRAFT_424737, partial [Absidia repens]
MSQQQFGNQILIVNAIGATFEKDGQLLGKQDPYLQLTLNLEDKQSFQKTYTHKNGGKNPSWNQSFTLPLRGEPDLFVEVLDEENMAPALVGFAAIPINQVVHAPGASFNGIFELYNVKGKAVGDVNLVLQAQGFQNSSNQQPQGTPIRGQSYVNEIHQKHCKSVRNKEHASEVGGALLGGALAIGAGLLGKKYYDDHKKNEEEDRQRQEDEERRQQDYNQREQELKRREDEFSHRREEEDRQRRDNEHHGHGGERHGHHQHHNSGAREWDSVGTYSAGDRVEYHGRTYLCLQGHTSNPTWEPTAAHSLWRA